MSLNQINNAESGSIVRGKLNAWLAQILTNITNIATNTANIATNTTNIATNTTAITNNTNGIGSLTSDVATINTTLGTKQDAKAISTVFDEIINATTNYTIPNSDNNVFVDMRNTGATNLTIPVSSSIPKYAFGKSFQLFNDPGSSNNVIIAAAGGVTVVYANGLDTNIVVGRYALLKHLSNNNWIRLL